MKNLHQYALALMLCSLSTFGQEPTSAPEKIAVYVFGAGEAGINKSLNNKLLFALTQNGKYAEIANSETFYNELAKSPDGGPGQATQTAKKHGADFLCLVSMNEVFGAYSISARIIKTSNSQVTKSASLDRTLKSLEDLTMASDELARQLLGLPPPAIPAPTPAKPATAEKPPKKGSKKPSKSVIHNGGFVDNRDNRLYKATEIGDQIWMAENLNYASADSKCYRDNPENCDKYGRLYDWLAAMEICPSGWHIPSDDEWDDLIDYAGGSSKAGKHLKAANGWNSNGNGTDRHGFSALPGGHGSSSGGFSDAGTGGRWWSASESYRTGAYHRHMYHNSDHVGLGYDDGSFLFSIRCVKD